MHSAVGQLHLNKTGKKKERMEEGGNRKSSSSGLGPIEQQGGLAGTELTKDLGGSESPELHPPRFRNRNMF